MAEKRILELIRQTRASYEKAGAKALKIAQEAAKYIDWDDGITCEEKMSDGLVIVSENCVVPVDAFFELAFEQGYVSEEDFTSLSI